MCGKPEYLDGARDVVKNPVLVVEVLSPSTEAWDRGGKFAHSVLELPPGKAAFFNIRVGDRLTIAPNG